MNYLGYPVTYTVRGQACSAFSFVKKNKTTATYEFRTLLHFVCTCRLFRRQSSARTARFRRKYPCWHVCLKTSHCVRQRLLRRSRLLNKSPESRQAGASGWQSVLRDARAQRLACMPLKVAPIPRRHYPVGRKPFLLLRRTSLALYASAR